MALDNGDIQQQQCVCLLIICFTTVDVESLWLILVFNFPHPDVYLSVLDIWTLDYSSIQSRVPFVPSGSWCQQHAAQGPLLSKILWHTFSMVNKCWRTKSEGQMRSATETLHNKGGIVEYRNACLIPLRRLGSSSGTYTLTWKSVVLENLCPRQGSLPL